MKKQVNFKILKHKSAKKPSELSLLAICVIFLMGPAVYVYDSAISGINIISAILFPIIIFSMFRRKYNLAGWAAFLGLGLLIILSLFTVFMEVHPANLRLLSGALVSSAAVWGTAWVVKHHQQLVPKVLYLILLIFTLIAVLQISYLMMGVGLDPSARFGDEGFYAGNMQLIGVPSIFGNPNDFSVFACLVFLYFLLVGGNRLSIPLMLSLFCILVSGSKTAIIIAVAGFLMDGGRSNIKYLALFVFLAFFYLLDGGFEGSGIYGIDRTLFTFIEILSNSLDAQSSASVRYESWAYFFREYHRFIFGTFSAAGVFPQFLYAPFDTSLIQLNPHSFIIEVHALFGFGGLLISIALFLTLYKSMSRHHKGYEFIYIFFSVFLLVNVSSSILRSGSTYALIALLALSPVSRSSVLNAGKNSHFRPLNG